MKNYKGVMFIGDTVLSNTRPGRRLDENFSEIAFNKLENALNIAKGDNLKPVIIGSLTKRPFEISVYSRLIPLLSGRDILMIAGANEYKGAGTLINPHSTGKLLHESGIISLAEEAGISEKILINTVNGAETVCLLSVPERQAAPVNIGLQEGVKTGERVIILAKGSSEFDLNDELDPSIKKEAFEWPGCDLFVTEKMHANGDLKTVGRTTWLNTGPLVRHQIEHESAEPRVWVWHPGVAPEAVSIKHDRHVFDIDGFASEVVQDAYDSSEFTQMLKNESIRAQENTQDSTFLDDELKNIFQEKSVSPDAREIVFELMGKTTNPASALEGVF